MRLYFIYKTESDEVTHGKKPMITLNKKYLAIILLIEAGYVYAAPPQQQRQQNSFHNPPAIHSQHPSAPTHTIQNNHANGNFNMHRSAPETVQRNHEQGHRHNESGSAPFVDYFFSSPLDETVYPATYENDNSYVTEQSNENNENEDGNWVSAQNGEVPANAVISEESGTYSCRSFSNNTMYYGVVVPQGCNVKIDNGTILFNSYDVLTQ